MRPSCSWTRPSLATSDGDFSDTFDNGRASLFRKLRHLSSPPRDARLDGCGPENRRHHRPLGPGFKLQQPVTRGPGGTPPREQARRQPNALFAAENHLEASHLGNTHLRPNPLGVGANRFEGKPRTSLALRIRACYRSSRSDLYTQQSLTTTSCTKGRQELHPATSGHWNRQDPVLALDLPFVGRR